MGINFIAHLNSTGYGVCATNVFLELSKRMSVALFPLGQVEPDIARLYPEEIQAGLQNARKYVPYAASLRIWHENDLAMHVGRGSKMSMSFFELDTLDEIQRHHLNDNDVVFVASEWAKSILKQNHITTEIIVAPLGVDRNVFNETVDDSLRLSEDTTTFLNIGKAEIRKGHDFLIDCFNKAFEPGDNVALNLCFDNWLIDPRKMQQWRELAKGSRMGAHINLIRRLPDQASIARLMSAADCGIFPSRAEAWNLELLEMMSCGKRVITTAYAGHTEYVNPGNALVIEPDELEYADDGQFFHGTGRWMKLGKRQEEQMILYMRGIHQGKQQGIVFPNTCGIETAKRLSWANTVDRILSYQE